MSVSLEKGQNISLEKEAPGATKFTLGLGWDENAEEGADFDLDATLLMLDKDGKIANGDDKYAIFYKNLKSPCESIVHTGDNLTGSGPGDDESILIDTAKIPAVVERLMIVITIHKAEERKQNFGQVSDAGARLYVTEDKKQVANFDLTEDYSTDTSVHVVDLYRHETSWKFKAIGTGSKKSLGDYMKAVGINVQ